MTQRCGGARRRRGQPCLRPQRALDDVSFSIAPASFTVLLGLNGAGKTTLFSLITHLYDTRQGAIRIFGHDVAPRARRGAAAARHGLSGAHPRPRSQREPEPRLSCIAARHRRREARRRIDEAAGDGRPERPPARQGAQPFGRPDAPRRDRPRAAAPAAAAPARRGDGRARHPVARRHPGQYPRAGRRRKASASCGQPI